LSHSNSYWPFFSNYWSVEHILNFIFQIDFPADKGEIQLFNLLKKWADVNSEERGAQFGELVCKALRLDLMNLSDLIDVVSKDILVVASEGATSEVLKVIEYKQNNGIPAGRMRGNEAVLITGGSVPIIDEFKEGIFFDRKYTFNIENNLISDNFLSD
jgi:hypothetical protein